MVRNSIIVAMMDGGCLRKKDSVWFSEVDRPLTAEVAEQQVQNVCGRRSEEIRGKLGVVGFSTSGACLKSLKEPHFFFHSLAITLC